MDRARELDLLGRLLDLHGQHTSSLASAPRRQQTRVYSDSDRHQQERAVFDTARAHIVGLACDLPAPGSYFTTEVGRVPLLLARSAEGRAVAFLNACRHRGSTLASGRGSGSRGFVCPYHGWTYSLAGEVKARPMARGAFDEGARCDHLIELPCAEGSGLLVVGSGPDVKLDVPALLAGLGDEIASHGLGDYRLIEERSKAWPFNWKLGIETFMEAYHIFSLHRESLAMQLQSAPMLSEFFGPHGRGVVMGKDCPALLNQSRASWTRFHNATFVYWLFPDVVLSMPQSGHAELWTFAPADDRPDRSTITVRFYAAPAAPQDDDFWKRLINFTMGVVEAEDFGQQCGIQRSIDSGLLPEIVFGRNEPALIHFHQQLDALLGASGI